MTENSSEGIVASDYDFALFRTAQFVRLCMNPDAIEDILIVSATPHGAMQFIGTGRVHPSKEDITLHDGAVLIFRTDLLATMEALAAEAEAGGDGDGSDDE